MQDLPSLEQTTMRKVSARLIPFLFLLYVAAYLDRINIGYAQLQMKQALAFSDVVYGLGSGIFFLGYILFEIPSNLILARLGARLWIARIVITWGIISSAMALVHTPATFYVLRFLLGAAEAGFFPGIIFYLTLWFPAAQRGSAVARFFMAAAVSGIIGGPLSGALFTLEGVGGLAGWQWIFLAEGIPSILLGIAVLFYLTDRPEGAKWLSPQERECLIAMLRKETDEIAKRGQNSLRQAFLHPTVWRLGLLSFTLLVGLYTISFWLPQIVQSFSGLGNVETAILSAVPYLAATVVMLFVVAHSDHRQERCLHVAGSALLAAAGLTASAFAHSPVPGLIALSAAAAGIFSAIPIFWSLPTAFLSGTTAAATLALINSFGNLGGFIAPYLIGRVLEASGSFAISLLSAAAVLLGGALLAFSLRHSPANPQLRLAALAG